MVDMTLFFIANRSTVRFTSTAGALMRVVKSNPCSKRYRLAKSPGANLSFAQVSLSKKIILPLAPV